MLLPAFKLKNFFKNLFLLLFPFTIWIFLFQNTLIIGDSFQYLHWIKYFLTSITQGQYPLWDPYHSWGAQDNFDMRFVGEFNPFLYITLLLNLLGVSFMTAFFVYLIVYYFIGLIGFYLLAKLFFKDNRWAYLSYVLLMFCVLGQTMLEQLQIIWIAVPSIWFFYFLFGFLQTAHIKYFVGLTFACMILATTYMPFHFLSILLPLSITVIAFYFSDLKSWLSQCLSSLNEHRWITCFCLLSLGLSLIPGISWYTNAQSDEYVLNVNRSSDDTKEAALVNINSINIGGAATEISFEELFDDLDLGYMYFFYVSVFVFLVIALSIINPFNKRLAVLFFTTLFVLFQSLADVTPLHKFLYEHIFFYRLFRNYFFFLTLIIPMIILFGVEQLRVFLNQKSDNKQRNIFLVIFSILIHLCFFLFLKSMDHIIITSYVTVLLSMIFLVFYFLNIIKNFSAILVILTLIATLQPIETCFHAMNYRSGKQNLILNEPWSNTFSFKRPSFDEKPKAKWGYREGFKTMEDNSGYYTKNYFGTSYSHFFHEQLDRKKAQEYLKHKFVACDNVAFISQDHVEVKRVEQALADNANIAFVSGTGQPVNSKNTLRNAQYFAQNSDTLNVVQFNPNEIIIQTNFPSKKFLVYNDSYHSGWHANINGKKAEILRANIAFKGLWVDAGENVIHLYFGHHWFHLFNLCLIGYFIFFLFFSIRAFLKPL